MASGKTGKQRTAAQERDRARLYQARQDFHAGRTRRRSRDNLIAGIVAGVVILGAVGGQALYYSVGPGAPAPAPAETESPAPSISPSPTDAPTPGPTDTPTPAATPAPSPTS